MMALAVVKRKFTLKDTTAQLNTVFGITAWILMDRLVSWIRRGRKTDRETDKQTKTDTHRQTNTQRRKLDTVIMLGKKNSYKKKEDITYRSEFSHCNSIPVVQYKIEPCGRDNLL